MLWATTQNEKREQAQGLLSFGGSGVKPVTRKLVGTAGFEPATPTPPV
jgi:hypothetical protein